MKNIGRGSVLRCMTAVSLALLLLPSARQGFADAPDVFAVKDARIITVSSAPIEKGTVVVRNGIIEAVGSNIAIPADAWVIDGQNLVVYPGLIDATSDIGLPQQPSTQPATAVGRGAALAAAATRQSEPVSNMNPYVRASDILTTGGKKAEDARAAGITTVLAAPDRGIFSGQSALVNLNGEKDAMVVRSPVAMHVRLSSGRGFGEYPGSLMGMFAYIKQALLDARRYQEAWEVYNQNIRSLRRPENSRAMEALLPVVEKKIPLVVPANSVPEIMRAIKLGEQEDVRYIISGASEGWKVASLLKEKQVPVLVSLKFPEKEKDVHPEAEESLREMQRRADAPRNAALLQSAGVQFAFFSDGMTNFRDFVRNAGRTVKAGLPVDAALRAVTLSAAEILGAQEQLGSIEKGKIANLFITDGDLFAEKTKIRYVFVDGKKFDVPAEESKPTEPAQVNLTGKWNVTIHTPQGSNPATFEFTQSENDLTGSVSSAMGTTAFSDGVVSGMFLAAATAGAAETPKTTLIKNATILTVTNGAIENGSVLIEKGKIAEVGKNIPAPSGAEVIDGKGMYVMPGIIDCHSHIAIDGGVNEGSLSVTAMVGVGDVINPNDIDIYRDLAGGVTTANVLHGSANAIGGKNAVIKLRWGKDADGLMFEGAKPGIKFALGENPKRSNFPGLPGAERRYPATRMGVEDVIRDAFTRARDYMRQWDDYNAKKKSGTPALPPRKDLELETLAEVLRGERMVHSHCYRADEILMLIRLADEFGFKIAAFQHVLEGYKVAKEISAHGAGASTFSDWWAYKMEAYDAIPYNAAIMTRKGVIVSINSDSAEEARHLNQEAAKCMKYGGLSETEALKLVTLNPAKQLRIDDRVGSIEKGKDADLVIYNHHPLSPTALPQKVLIDGIVYFDREKDKERQKEIVQMKRKLKEEEEKAARPPRREAPRGKKPENPAEVER